MGSCRGWCKDHSLGSSTSAWDDYKVKLPFVIISKIVGISKKLPFGLCNKLLPSRRKVQANKSYRCPWSSIDAEPLYRQNMYSSLQAKIEPVEDYYTDWYLLVQDLLSTHQELYMWAVS